jgi:co-chaperonin GroES (HSP10)
LKVYPKNRYIQIKPYEETKKGNIEIPVQHRKKVNFGTVIAVSKDESVLSIGDEVYFKKRPMAMLEDETVVIPVEHVLMKTIWN